MDISPTLKYFIKRKKDSYIRQIQHLYRAQIDSLINSTYFFSRKEQYSLMQKEKKKKTKLV